MPPSMKSHTPHSTRGSLIIGRCAARAIPRLLSACADNIRALVAYLRDDADPERPQRSHVTTMATLIALGWRVAEIRPSVDAPVLWRVTIERHDGAVSISVIDAANPDAALEELARYAAADAEDRS